MTLILGVISDDTIVVAADGAEFERAPGQANRLSVGNRQKLVPVVERPVVLAVHGQNRLIPTGNAPDVQVLVNEFLEQMDLSAATVPTLKELSELILDQLSPTVASTFANLESSRIHTSALKITVFGFDETYSRPQGYELTWPMLSDRRHPFVAELGCKPITVFHGATGEPFAIAAIGQKDSRCHPDFLSKSPGIAELQRYLQRLYAKAEALQRPEDPEFGGHYHEYTITKRRGYWSKEPVATGQIDS